MKVLHWVCVLVERTNMYLCVWAAQNMNSLSAHLPYLGTGVIEKLNKNIE